MVETIAPVVHGERRSRWRASVALHALGATVAAGAFGAALGGAGALLGAPWGRAGLMVVAAIAATYAAGELIGLPVPVPDRRRQVPEWWRTFFPAPMASFLYGLGLGVGFLTYLRHGTLVAVSSAALVSGDPFLGAALVAPFGVARGISVLVSHRATSGAAIASAVERLERLAQGRLPSLGNGIVLLAMGIAAAVAAARALPAGTSSGIGGWVLAAIFGWAAAAKVLRREAWIGALQAYGLGALERSAAIGVPVAEAGVLALVVAGAPRAGALWALALVVAFSAAILRPRARVGDRLPCGCFGRTGRRDVRLVLFRNAAVAGLAVLVAAAPGGSEPLRWPSGSEILPAVLVAGAAVLAGLLVRELGRMPRRPAAP
jgi:hypothetical protein